MKPVTSYFLGVGSVLLLAAALATAAQRPALAWAGADRSPQISGLDAAQQAQLVALRAQVRQGRQAAHAGAGELIEHARAELAKPDADLRMLGAHAESVLLPILIDARANREARIAFYESLDATQQAEVRTWLQHRLDRAERIHALVGDFLADAP